MGFSSKPLMNTSPVPDKLVKIINQYNNLVEHYDPEVSTPAYKRELKKSYEFVVQTCNEIHWSPSKLGVRDLPL